MGMGIAMRANKNLYDKFISYVQENYRLSLNYKDYEILKDIFENCDLSGLDNAVEYAKKKTDSLIYLKKILTTKEYEKNLQPKWLNQELQSKPMSETELKEMEELLKEFR